MRHGPRTEHRKSRGQSKTPRKASHEGHPIRAVGRGSPKMVKHPTKQASPPSRSRGIRSSRSDESAALRPEVRQVDGLPHSLDNRVVTVLPSLVIRREANLLADVVPAEGHQPAPDKCRCSPQDFLGDGHNGSLDSSCFYSSLVSCQELLEKILQLPSLGVHVILSICMHAVYSLMLDLTWLR